MHKNNKEKAEGKVSKLRLLLSYLPCFFLVLLFLIEAAALFLNSGFFADVEDGRVAKYALDAKLEQDKENINPGGIRDRNGTEIYWDNGTKNVGKIGNYYEEISKKLYKDILSIENSGKGILHKYERVLYTPSEDEPGIIEEMQQALDRNLMNDDTNIGDSLVLTLDHELQKKAYETMKKLVGEKNQGSMVIMDADTGEILADVTTFLLEDLPTGSTERNGLPMTVGGIIAPGSTFKTISLITMFENDIEDVEFEDESSYEDEGVKIHNYEDYEEEGGRIGSTEAFRKSSNVYFARAMLGLDNAKDKMSQKAKSIYLQERLCLDFITIGADQTRWTFAKKTWKELEERYPDSLNAKQELADSAYGQAEIRMSTLQGAMIAAGIINDGKIIIPHMIDKVVDINGKELELSDVVEKINVDIRKVIRAKELDEETDDEEITESEIEPPAVENGAVLSVLTSPEIAQSVLDIMKYTAVEEYGFDEELGVAAKSGTAEEGFNGERQHAWMISCANINGHNYAIAANWRDCGKHIGGSKLKQSIEDMYVYLQNHPITYHSRISDEAEIKPDESEWDEAENEE